MNKHILHILLAGLLCLSVFPAVAQTERYQPVDKTSLEGSRYEIVIPTRDEIPSLFKLDKYTGDVWELPNDFVLPHKLTLFTCMQLVTKQASWSNRKEIILQFRPISHGISKSTGAISSEKIVSAQPPNHRPKFKAQDKVLEPGQSSRTKAKFSSPRQVLKPRNKYAILISPTLLSRAPPTRTLAEARI